MNRYHNYIFLDQINSEISLKIKTIKKVSIIYYIDDFNPFNENNCKLIRNFCKKISAPFYIINSFKIAVKYKAAGIYITADNRRIILNKYNKLKIIGSVHNNLDYYFKTIQNCRLVMLSPLFYNKKYSRNKILGSTRFKLISRNWKIELCPLGGINNSNLNRIKLLRISNVAHRSMLKSI
jgi:thiamine monophosphate synthase